MDKHPIWNIINDFFLKKKVKKSEFIILKKETLNYFRIVSKNKIFIDELIPTFYIKFLINVMKSYPDFRDFCSKYNIIEILDYVWGKDESKEYNFKIIYKFYFNETPTENSKLLLFDFATNKRRAIPSQRLCVINLDTQVKNYIYVNNNMTYKEICVIVAVMFFKSAPVYASIKLYDIEKKIIDNREKYKQTDFIYYKKFD